MYILGPRDHISIPVRVDSVQTVPNRFHGNPELRVEATLRLSPNAYSDTKVILWANAENIEHITVSEDFVARDVSLEGDCPGGQCYKAKAGLSAIWFSNERLGDDVTCLALVRDEVF